MDEIYTKLVENKISEKLINQKFYEIHKNENELFSDNQNMFEQYKLLVDSAHKAEERRGGSNNIFLGINTLLASFLIRPTQLNNIEIGEMLISILFVLIGMFISWEWIRVNISYKRLNFINYALINAFEKFLPTYVFTLRGQIEAEQEKEKRPNITNIILIKENLLPKAFFTLYFIYFLTMIFHIFK